MMWGPSSPSDMLPTLSIRGMAEENYSMNGTVPCQGNMLRKRGRREEGGEEKMHQLPHNLYCC